jgi:hypothetical protein
MGLHRRISEAIILRQSLDDHPPAEYAEHDQQTQITSVGRHADDVRNLEPIRLSSTEIALGEV